jgi:hypothetical protein
LSQADLIKKASQNEVKIIKTNDNVAKNLTQATSSTLKNSKSFEEVSKSLYKFVNENYGRDYIFHITVGLKGFTDLNTVDRDHYVASFGDILVKIESYPKKSRMSQLDAKQ